VCFLFQMFIFITSIFDFCFYHIIFIMQDDALLYDRSSWELNHSAQVILILFKALWIIFSPAITVTTRPPRCWIIKTVLLLFHEVFYRFNNFSSLDEFMIHHLLDNNDPILNSQIIYCLKQFFVGFGFINADAYAALHHLGIMLYHLYSN